jgi:hypothetical protein
MLQIKRFIEKVSLSEGRRMKDVVLPLDEARFLRDELAKLLSDLHDKNSSEKKEEIIKVQITGGSFK